MKRLTGKAAAERLTRAYECKGEGHHVGHFKNNAGGWTVFEAEDEVLHYAETTETESFALSRVDRLEELEREREEIKKSEE